MNIAQKKARSARTQEEGEVIAVRAKDHLERYFFVLVFNAYLRSQAYKNFEVKFSEWYKERAEIQTVLEELYSHPQKSMAGKVANKKKNKKRKKHHKE